MKRLFSILALGFALSASAASTNWVGAYVNETNGATLPLALEGRLQGLTNAAATSQARADLAYLTATGAAQTASNAYSTATNALASATNGLDSVARAGVVSNAASIVELGAVASNAQDTAVWSSNSVVASSNFFVLENGTLTTNLNTASNALRSAITNAVDLEARASASNAQETADAAIPLSGGTMTGPLYLSDTNLAMVFKISGAGDLEAKSLSKVSDGITNPVVLKVVANGTTNSADENGIVDLGTIGGGGTPTTNAFAGLPSLMVAADWTWTNMIYAVGVDTSTTNISVTLPDAGTNFTSIVIRKFSNLNQLFVKRGTNIVYTLNDDGSARAYDWWPTRTNWYWRN